MGSLYRRVHVNRFAIVLAVLAVLSWCQEAAAQDRIIAGRQTVAEWRRVASTNEAFSLGYASGAMSFMNVFSGCKVPGSVGELQAFLLYGADASLNMQQALVVNASQRGCTALSSDDLQRNIAR